LTRDQLNNGHGRAQSPAALAGRARPLNRITVAAAVAHAGTGPYQTCVTVNINMEFKHPKYYAELRKLRRKLTSSQASSAQAPSRKPKAQASSQNPQAPGSDDQGTSAQAHEQGYKQQE